MIVVGSPSAFGTPHATTGLPALPTAITPTAAPATDSSTARTRCVPPSVPGMVAAVAEPTVVTVVVVASLLASPLAHDVAASVTDANTASGRNDWRLTRAPLL